MITTTQDAWVKSFIGEPAITAVILDLSLEHHFSLKRNLL